MTKRRTALLSFAAIALVALFLPADASAQWGTYRRDRDRDRDYRRDRDYGRDRRRNDDGYYGRDGYYNGRALRDAVRRVESRSDDFEDRMDSFLDRSRIDGTNREDRINDDVKEFRRAAERLKDRIGDGRDPNRGANEARALLQSASRIDRFVSRVQLDSRTYSEWSQIRQDLRTIADVYGYNGGFRDDGYNRRGDYGRDRDNRNRGSIWNLPIPWPRN